MENLTLTPLVFIGAVVAGLLGSLTGLGGGIVIVPLLTVMFGVDIHYAIGAALVSVIATSCGSAGSYVKEGYSNLRVAMFLEVATCSGAIGGAYLAIYCPTAMIAVIFGLVLLSSGYLSLRPPKDQVGGDPPDPLATFLQMHGSYPTPEGPRDYQVRKVPLGFAIMVVAGLLSGLLGIGSGALKVLAMDQVMRLPFKASTTTSNFMIGVTAAASAGIYLHRGYINPGLAMPVVLGVLVGAWLGARLLVAARVKPLRIIFTLVILALGVRMIVQGLMGFKTP